MKPIDIPVFGQPMGMGPGSQPQEADGTELQYLAMPRDMQTYQPMNPPEKEDAASCRAAMAKLERLLALLRVHRAEDSPELIDLSELDAADRDLIHQSLGEGEVSVLYTGSELARIQETRLAGVWRVRSLGQHGGIQRDVIEVADIPGLVRASAFRHAKPRVAMPEHLPEGVMNAPPLVAELNDRSASYRKDRPPHVLNLSLLPQSEADLLFLEEVLGLGPVTILSRGYGNCRITATGLRSVWWVQHFNSEDTLILNTLEVVDVPAVALAAQEDLEDSAERLAEMLDSLR